MWKRHNRMTLYFSGDLEEFLFLHGNVLKVLCVCVWEGWSPLRINYRKG